MKTVIVTWLDGSTETIQATSVTRTTIYLIIGTDRGWYRYILYTSLREWKEEK